MRYKLGQLIEQYDEINDKGEFQDLESLQGINSLKYFQECKSNKNDIDLYRYRICRKGMFAYNRATSRNGEKLSIAYREGDDCLISPSYYCFKIVREDLLLADYLMIWLKRPVFDKYARFHSWGSATEFFTFEDFCNTEIALPSIEEQRKIVHNYKVITNRIKLLNNINENLDNQLNTEFKKIYKGSGKFKISFRDEIEVIRGVSYKPEDVCNAPSCKVIPLLRANNIENQSLNYNDVIYIPKILTKEEQIISKDDILISMSSGSQSAVGKVAIANENMNCVFGAFCGKIRLIGKNKGIVSTYFKSNLFRNYLKEILLGTTINNIKQEDLNNIEFRITYFADSITFERKYELLNNVISNNKSEITTLQKLKELMILKISKEVA